jgi:hypothetical protein
MKRLSSAMSPDTWLALGLFLLLTLFTTISVVQQAQATLQEPPLASFSTQPDGSRALWLYLQSQNVKLTDSAGDAFGVPTGVDLALVLEPTEVFSSGEWQLLLNWVEAGGTLLIAGTGSGTIDLAERLEVRFGLAPSTETAVSNQTPLLNTPPLKPIPSSTPWFLRPSRNDFVTLVANRNGNPTAVAFAEGKGRVILTTLTEPFSNEGIQTEGNAELLFNLLNGTPELSSIWFDEWHHGIRPAAADALASNNWLQRTPVGQSLLLLLAIIFIGLILRGRHFGRTVPLPKSISRRAPLEYIRGIANLSRRAGHRTAVLQDYRHRLKKELGHRYRLNPSLPDDEFIAQLANYQANLDIDALQKLLQKLSKSNISENEMVQLAREAASFGK